MSRRRSFKFALPTLATVLAAAAVVSAACGGEAYGDCVTVYSDGEVNRYSTDKAYCEQTCEERMAMNPGLISRCYFAGSVASPLEP